MRRVLGAAAAAVLLIAGAAGRVTAQSAPSLHVEVLATGLSIPWDLAPVSGGVLITERAGKISFVSNDGQINPVSANMTDLWVSGETGLMAIEADPNFALNRRVYTCQGTTDRYLTVQVIAWTINASMTAMRRVKDPLVGGIDGRSGRHGGCQLRFDRYGWLRVGTGDAAWGTNPQNRWSLAGKTLRVSPWTGAGATGNITTGDRRIYSYGHRNVQGLALSPSGAMYSVEHGTDRDDEINLLRARGNYGWSPTPGYNEARPMTDLTRYPSAVSAVWSSGAPTVATSGATFLVGAQWGPWNGALAVSCLKASELRIYRIVGGSVTEQWTPSELDGTYGRLRAAEVGADGALYVTTSNGTNDKVLRITPR